MKNVYILAGLLFLASCGQAETTPTNSQVPATPETIVEQTVETVEEELEEEVSDIIEELIETASDDESESEEVAQPEAAVIPEESTQEVAETAAEEIDTAVAELETVTQDSSKTITLNADYNNPKGLIDMRIEYTLDSEGVITDITTYREVGTEKHVDKINVELQDFIGSTLEEAAEFSSSSSLAGEAFRSAIKEQL